MNRLHARLVAVIAPVAMSLLAHAALAQPLYDFILVNSLNANPLAGEAFLWDINDQGMACGVATIDNVIGYPGVVWTEAEGSTRISVASPQSVNNHGLVVGIGDILDLSTGQIYVPPNLPGTYYAPQFGGVNDMGIAVGSISITSASDSGGVLRIPYIWDAVNGARTVSVPNAKGLSRVNSAGVAIGWTNGWVFNDGFFVDLASGSFTYMNDIFPANIGAGPTRVFDINDAGVIVGTRQGTGQVGRYGYVYTPGSGIRILPFAGAGYQQAVRPFGINNSGVIVGELLTTFASSRAFVFSENAGMRDLNSATIVAGIPAGYSMRTAERINDLGWIAGNGTMASGKNTGYILKPRPTPCPADFNHDSAANSQDFFDFLTAFFALAPAADFNADAVVNSQDFFDFVAAFFVAC